MIRIFLMLMTLMLVNGLDIQIVDAGELNYESDGFLVQGNTDGKVFQRMEKFDFDKDYLNLQMDEVFTDITKIGTHQVGFTSEFETVHRYYAEELLGEIIDKFDFG